MDNLADIIFNSVLLYLAALILDILMVVSSLLFMNYSSNYLGHKLSVGWYICGVLFGPLTLIIFLIKRKDFPGPDSKKCYKCETYSPASETLCRTCQTELLEINVAEKRKAKKRSKIFGAIVIITYILCIILGAVLGYSILSEPDNIDDTNYRISVNGVFYDKMGNAYENENDVVFYDKDGRTYTYFSESVEVEDSIFYYDEEYYIRDDGEKYFVVDCYVNEDGWFYCDKAYTLELYYEDTLSMSEEELDIYYQEQMSVAEKEYKYYDYPYVDGNGTLYYCAYEASWNEKGELITANNDIY